MKKLLLSLIVLLSASIVLAAQPVITNQPSSRVVWASGNVTFAVGVSGDGLFSYQWQLNSNSLPDGIITTVAGNGTLAYSGDGASALCAGLNPVGVAVDASDNVVIADHHSNGIRKVDTNGIITTVAGNGTNGFSGDGGVATNANLYHPFDVAVDAFGNLLIVDEDNQRIRKVDTNGIITTVAGNGTNGFSGDGGAATNGSLAYPLGVAVDAAGNLFIADTGNNRIREVRTNGVITTVAGNGTRGSAGDGGAATNASFASPSGVAVDVAGNLFIVDTGNSRIREVTTDGNITLVAGGGNGSDISAATNASLLFPERVAVDAHGNLFIADTFRWLVRKASTNGTITTVAGNGNPGYTGDGGAATNASLNAPCGVAVDASGNLFIADAKYIRKVIPTQGPSLALNNVMSTNAGNYQVVVTSPGGSVTSSVANLTVYTITSQPVCRTNVQGTTATFSVDVGGITPVTYQWFKNGVVLTNGGNVAGTIASTLTLSNVQDADAASYTVVVSNNLAGSVTSPSAFLTVIDWPVITNQLASQAVWTGGNVAFGLGVSGTGLFTYQWQFNSNSLPNGILTTVAGNGAIGFSGDGGTATNASFYWPSAVALDASGNLFIVDAWNNRVREVNNQGIVKTVAGVGPSGNSGSYSGDGGSAINANLSLNYGLIFNNTPQASGVALDAHGNLFIADYGNNRVRKVNTNGIITTFAGTGASGYSGNGVAATNANLAGPCGIALDAAGNLFIADKGNHRIRKVDTNGIIITVAGNGSQGSYSGDGIAATNASLYYPSDIAVDAVGNFFIADSQNARIRKVDSSGIITTVAGNNGSGYFGDNVAATNTSLFAPFGVMVDAGGNLFIADTGNSRVREVSANGIITTFAGGGVSYPGEGGAATNASLNYPSHVVMDAFGNLFIADQEHGRIRKVTNTQWPAFALNNVSAADAGIYQVVVAGPAGSVTSSVANLAVGTITSQPASRANLAGTKANFSVVVGGIASLTYQWLKNGVAMTDGGNVSGSTAATLTLTNVQDADAAPYTVVVSNNLAGSLTSSPALLSVIDITAQPVSQCVWPGGNVSFAMGVSGTGPLTYQWQLNGTNLPNGIITTFAGGGASYPGDGGAATNASLNAPQTVALDALGNVFIADTGNNRIREISTNGTITTVAGGGVNYPGDGSSATNTSLGSPAGVAVDASGNLFIADSQNARICKVDTNGIITTLVGANGAGFSGDGGPATNAKLYNPQAVAVDAAGNLFVADYGNNRIREIDTNCIITTLAGTNTTGYSGDGGPASNAKLSNPQAVAVDASGKLFIADTMNNRIRKVNTNGIIATLAGTNSIGFSGDGGSATIAKLSHPFGMAVDASGNLFVADTWNNRIRKVDTSGIITTIAGTNSAGFSGDGGAATVAKLYRPAGVAVDASGNLLIADTSNRRIRQVINTQGPSLTLCNVSADNAGNYQLVVTGPGGSVTSSVAVLAVVLPLTSFTAQMDAAGLQIQFTGTPNYPYILQMATNLAPPVVWQSILTNPADASGNWSWGITNLSAYPAGYYRAAAGP